MTLFALIFAFGLLVGVGIGVAIGHRLYINQSAGEALVANAIEASLPQPRVLLNNVTLPAETGSTQIDHVLITTTGIFVIETKHYSGWIFGDPNQSHWTQTIFKKKSRFQNPLHQNYGHIKALQSLFNLPEDNFFSLVVFTGGAEFKTDLGPGVIKLDELIAYLTQPRPHVFDEKKIAYIVGRIEMKRLRRSAETDEYHLNYVRSRLGPAAEA